MIGNFETVHKIEAMRNRMAAGETSFTFDELRLVLNWADHLNYRLSIESGIAKDTAALPLKKQGRCETTLTERVEYTGCKCGTYPDNLGPCLTWEVGVNPERCVFCDHKAECHIAVLKASNAAVERETIERCAKVADDGWIKLPSKEVARLCARGGDGMNKIGWISCCWLLGHKWREPLVVSKYNPRVCIYCGALPRDAERKR